MPQGARVDSFEIRSLLGAGGFGITYLAFDHQLEQTVALKEFCPVRLATRADDGTSLRLRSSGHSKYFDAGRAAFLAEARALAQFRHSSIVRVSRHLEAFGTAYIAMDYEQGDTLRARLRGGASIDEAAAQEIFVPLLDGLGAVHRRDFLHGDVKPGNVILRADGTPVLIDFGAARGGLSQERQGTLRSYTPGYASPEQHVDVQEAGPWSDVYGVGATLFHCLSGRVPPPATERVFASYFGRPDPLDSALDRSIGASYPAAAGVIRSALALKVSERLHGVDEFLQMWRSGKAAPRATAVVTQEANEPARSDSITRDETTSVSSASRELPVMIDAGIRRMAENHLAEYLDPAAARRLALEHSLECRSHEEYYQRLGAHIRSDTRREEFIAAVMLGEYLQ